MRISLGMSSVRSASVGFPLPLFKRPWAQAIGGRCNSVSGVRAKLLNRGGEIKTTWGGSPRDSYTTAGKLTTIQPCTPTELAVELRFPYVGCCTRQVKWSECTCGDSIENLDTVYC